MDERQEALTKALKEIEKQFGKGAIMRLGDETKDIKGNVIPTGSLTLDVALGVGGYPKGRIIEIYGPESAGKTTFALHAIASSQKAGGYAAFIDAEHALDPGYAKALGVDVENLILSQPDNGEQALEIAEELIKSAAVDIIVVDSVAALVPMAELNGDMGDSHIGLHARLMSQAMRKLSALINKSNVVVIFINQIREKVGILFGSPEVTTGGRALKFYSTIRLEVRRSEQIKDSSANVIGNKTTVKVVKNKVAPPFKIAEVEIIYGEGVSYFSDIIEMALKFDIFKRAGAWYSYESTKLGQGKENVKEYLRENIDFTKEIEQRIKELL